MGYTEVDLGFKGQGILELREMSDNMTECVTLPFLNNECDWVPSDYPKNGDRVHTLIINDCALDIPDVAYTNGGLTVANSQEYTGNGFKFDWHYISDSGESIPLQVYSFDLDLENLPSGQYCFIVLNTILECEVENCIYVAPSMYATFTLDHNCSDDNIDICVEIEGGSGAFTYLWNNTTNITTSCIYGVDAWSSNTVKVTDQVTGVTESFSVYPSSYQPLVVTNTSAVQSCPIDANNGSACVEILEGTGTAPFVFTWSNGIVTNNNCVENLANGEYQVTITDACDAEIVETIELNNPVLWGITDEVSPADPTCPNGAVSLSINALNGQPPYEFDVINGEVITQGDDFIMIGYLPVGTGTVIISDQCNNTITYNFDIPESTTSSWIDITTTTNPVCSDNAVGIELNIEGVNPVVIDGDLSSPSTPIGDFTYLWSNGATTEDVLFSPNSNLDDEYSVTVTSSSIEGCSYIIDGIEPPLLTEPPSEDDWNFSYTVSPFCNEDQDITATFEAEGDGAGGALGPPEDYIYSWRFEGWDWNYGNPTYNSSGGGSIIGQNQISYGINEAGYIPYVVDPLTNCSLTVPQEFPNATIEIVSENISGVYINQNGVVILGEIEVVIEGGLPPYTYSWSNGVIHTHSENLDVIQGLEKGVYTVTVTDSNGCEATAVNLEVGDCGSNLSLVVANFQGFSSLNNGGCNPGPTAVNNSFIQFAVSGGTAPYTYTWDPIIAYYNGAWDPVTETYPNATSCLAATGYQTSNGYFLEDIIREGDYCVTVTDACGAQFTACQNMVARSWGIVWDNRLAQCGNKAPKIEMDKIAGVPETDYDGMLFTYNVSGPQTNVNGTFTVEYICTGFCNRCRLDNDEKCDAFGHIKVEDLAQGTYTVTVSDANNYTAVYEFYVQGIGCDKYDIPSPWGTESLTDLMVGVTDDNLPYEGENVIFNYRVHNACSNPSYKWGRLILEHLDEDGDGKIDIPDNPCAKGQIVPYEYYCEGSDATYCGPNPEIQLKEGDAQNVNLIPEEALITDFSGAGYFDEPSWDIYTCACYYPPGYTTPSFDFPILAYVNCNGDSDCIGNEIDFPPNDNDIPAGCGVVIGEDNPEECTIDYTCSITEEVLWQESAETYCRIPLDNPGDDASTVWVWCDLDLPEDFEFGGLLPPSAMDLGNNDDDAFILNNLGEDILVSDIETCDDFFFAPTFEELSISDIDVLESNRNTNNSQKKTEKGTASDIVCNAYPNPFHDFINIEILLKNSSSVLVSVHDVLGNELYLKERKVVNGISRFRITNLWAN